MLHSVLLAQALALVWVLKVRYKQLQQAPARLWVLQVLEVLGQVRHRLQDGPSGQHALQQHH